MSCDFFMTPIWQNVTKLFAEFLKIIYQLLESTASCWNKVNQLILTWQAFADHHAKATSPDLQEMLN